MANNSQFNGMQSLRPHTAPPQGPPQINHPPMPMQFRPTVPPQQPAPYIPVPSQQFLPVGGTNVGVPSVVQPGQFPQAIMQQSRPGQGGHIMPLPLPLPIPAPDTQPNRPVISVSPQPQQNGQTPNGYMPGSAGPRMPISSTYSIPSTGQPQMNGQATGQYQPIHQTSMPCYSAGGQPWLAGSHNTQPVTPMPHSVEQRPHSAEVPATGNHCSTDNTQSDWIEHTRRGRRFYYNKRTRVSTWEKPLELMTETERADASTDWREITSPNGVKYYHNRVTKKSTWTIPDEVKLARDKIAKESMNGTQEYDPASVSVLEASSPITDSTREAVTSTTPVAPVVAVTSLSACVESATTNAIGVQTPLHVGPTLDTTLGSSEVPLAVSNIETTSMGNSDAISAGALTTASGISVGAIEELKNGTSTESKTSITALEERTVDQEPVVYENKLEGKKAFIALLETSNIESDSTWDQAMKVIINDSRYAALKTLVERKQAFNEFLEQKKQQEAEERRAKQKKVVEGFKKMLEESQELTSSTRWSKAITIFEEDERFKAVERTKDRENLYEDYLVELGNKERAKALEEQKRNRMEYIEYLRSCEFIKASSQWRKVQDRLEADERCSRLEKIDRLEIFQEYLRDLEKEEEEQIKLRMEEARKAERRNRDDFRKLMEDHIAAGVLSVNTHWRDYCMKVKELPAYLAVSSNTSGATPKDLFEDVAEELEKQYLEDKARIKDAVKLGKVNLTSTWTIENLKDAVAETTGSHVVSDANWKLVYDELQERAREREEKEAKRRKRLADDFFVFLCSLKEVNASSRWEDCNSAFEDRFKREESFLRETFENYVLELKEKAREKERKRKEEKDRKDKDIKDREKRKAKERRDKERGKVKDRDKNDGSDSEKADREGSHGLEENRRSGRDRKHRKRHSNSADDLSFDEKDRDRSKSSYRHSSKKSKQIDQHPAEYDSRHKRHKREHYSGSHWSGDYNEQREREYGEDGEFW
ncbi:pre-mRNA-processing protein 40A [Daucus carota subsp. sativus]|uniref:pre-mRNA-processing protein 40A n=1 Tax=Daucus carota subsp. sativus TaxID=79200 RepID=UPI0007F032DA|nr:PREDICTED: pre-mRNA-processing protein 40A-like [Daucus carota subsp. sativus]XP_017222903.1 PREDICTED: pre-mRNA-processing protein 40A-like [Daucus carota subsp. sativus]